jgi:hypothetical protein
MTGIFETGQKKDSYLCASKLILVLLEYLRFLRYRDGLHRYEEEIDLESICIPCKNFFPFCDDLKKIP